MKSKLEEDFDYHLGLEDMLKVCRSAPRVLASSLITTSTFVPFLMGYIPLLTTFIRHVEGKYNPNPMEWGFSLGLFLAGLYTSYRLEKPTRRLADRILDSNDITLVL